MWPKRVGVRLRTPLLVIIGLLVAAYGWPAAVQATPSLRVTSVAVKVFPGIVQIAITGSGPLRYRASSTESPHRIVIDMPGAVLAEGVAQTLAVQQPPVVRVRAGQFQQSPAVARVAVDLTEAASFEVTTAGAQVVARVAALRPQAASRPRPVARAASSGNAPVAQAPAPTPTPVPIPDRITLDLRATEIADVLAALARLCAFNIVTDASVKGTITLRLIEVTCDEALRFILEANALGFRRVGRNIIVMAAEKLAPPPEIAEPVVYALGFANVDQVRTAITAAVPGVRVAVDPRTNTIIVFGTSAQHEQIRRILASLDVNIAQILIEVRVVDISTTVLRDLGLDWGLTSVPVLTTQGTFPSQVIVGIPAGTLFTVRLTALVREGKARVLTAPRVAVVEGNKATVNLGEEVPIPQIDANGRITFTFKPVGVILEITPRLNRDGLITSTVVPEVSSVIEFLDSGGVAVPRIATRKANTIVTVREGDSIVIAGLISAQERRTVIKVPLLGDIPIIGALFRRTITDRSETEVIFVVTPHVVPVPGASPTPTPRP